MSLDLKGQNLLMVGERWKQYWGYTGSSSFSVMVSRGSRSFGARIGGGGRGRTGFDLRLR
jgi:hypothetical protein